MSFLKAEWKKLILLSFEIPTQLLDNLIPKGTELDLWGGKCYISLVGFLFKETKVKGIKVPFHINFEEVNLRFYVKYTSHNKINRGVVFIKEIVPKPIIKFIANQLYNENYSSTKMSHQHVEDYHDLNIGYQWINNKETQSFSVSAKKPLRKCNRNSFEEFIIERNWGFSQNKNTTLAYEVRHPKWKIYDVISHNIDVDFESTYGNQYSFLNHKHPDSVILVEGSEVYVEYHSKIKQ